MASEKLLRSSGEATAALQEIVDIDLSPALARDPNLSILPAVSEDRRRQSLSEVPYEVGALVNEVKNFPTAKQEVDTVLYLAYGSNLCAETFRGRRGIKPLAQVNVVVPELRLTFDLAGLPYLEPCFANVEWREQSRRLVATLDGDSERQPLIDREPPPRFHKDRWRKGLVGVVYEVTKKDYATIIATEGGGAAYQDILVSCHVLADSASVPEMPSTPAFKAHTLCAPSPPSGDLKRSASLDTPRQRPVRGYAQPSSRYLKLITDGADEHHLPSEYQAYLHHIRPYTITQRKQRLGRFIFTAFWGPVIATVFAGDRLFADKGGRSPKWYARFKGAMFIAVWASYDVFFKGLFGDGERTAGQDDDNLGLKTHGPNGLSPV